MAVIRSFLFRLIFYTGSLYHTSLAFLGSFIAPEFMRYMVRQWAAYHRFCVTHILGIKVVVDGAMPERPLLYAFKHESMFETIDMPFMFRNPSVVAKKELFDIPLWGRAALSFGMIPVDRNAGAAALRQMLVRARAVIAAGRPIIIYPEGTRVPHGECPALQSGFAGLYKMLNLPVVPVAVDSGKSMPRGRLVWQPGVVHYKVGEEIPPGLPRDEVERRVHAAINALN